MEFNKNDFDNSLSITDLIASYQISIQLAFTSCLKEIGTIIRFSQNLWLILDFHRIKFSDLPPKRWDGTVEIWSK